MKNFTILPPPRILTLWAFAVLFLCGSLRAGTFYYYKGFNDQLAKTSSWADASGTSPSAINASDTYVIDRGSDGNNATTRLGENAAFEFPGTIYAGYTDTNKDGKLTIATNTARLCTKGTLSDSVWTVGTFGTLYLGNARLNQWTNGSPRTEIFKGNIVIGDGTNAGQVLFDSRASEVVTRTLIFADSISGKGTFFMANTKNAGGVKLYGSNENLGKVEWTIRQGTLTVGLATANETYSLAANPSSLGTDSTVTFDSNAAIPQDDTNNINYASSAANGTDKPALTFDTPASTTSDNTSVTVTTAANTNSTLNKTGAGAAYLGKTGVTNVNLTAGTLRVTGGLTTDNLTMSGGVLQLRGGTTTITPESVTGGVLLIDSYDTKAEIDAGIQISNVTVNGDMTLNDLDIGVNNRYITSRGTTTTFTMTADNLTVNGPANTLAWACKTIDVGGGDTTADDKTIVDLSGVKNVTLTAKALNIAKADGGGLWTCGAEVKLGTNNTITTDSFTFSGTNGTSGIYDTNTLEFGEGTNIVRSTNILWGGYKNGAATKGGSTVSIRENGSILIEGKTAGSKTNLTIGEQTGFTGMANNSVVDLTNASSATLNLGTLALSQNTGTYTSALKLGTNVSLSANSIKLGKANGATSTLSIQSGTVNLYGPVTSAGKSTFQMDDGTINFHIQDESQLNQALMSVNTLDLVNDAGGVDVEVAMLFDGDYKLSPSTSPITVFSASQDSMTQLLTALNNDWSNLFTPETNYLFNIGSTATTLTLTVNPNAIPEPATWVLLLVGIFGSAVIQRKK